MNIAVRVKNSDYYPQTSKVKWLLATRKLWVRFILGIPITLFLFWQAHIPHTSKYTNIIFGASVGVMAVYLFSLLRSWFKFSALGKKWLKLNQDANTDIGLDMTDTGIIFKDYRGNTEMVWNKFTLYSTFNGYLFIIQKNPGDAIVFKENSISKEQMNELLGFLDKFFYQQRTA